MVLWLLIAILATLVAGSLLAATRRQVGMAPNVTDPTQLHFQAKLAEIEADLRVNRLSDVEAEAAKADLAREVLAFRIDTGSIPRNTAGSGHSWILPTLALMGPLVGVVMYALIGQPNLPAQPIATRPAQVEIDFDDAVAQIEAQLAATPDDIRGWRALAPAYMSAERFEDAENAFERILALGGRDAGTLTDLAEAKLMQSNGVADAAILELLNEAIQIDPTHTRARFYLAGEATRAGDWDVAISMWEHLINQAEGGEPWLAVARNGLAVANARGEPTQPIEMNPDQTELIRGMVDQLAARLAQDGGTLEEWTRLVQSHLVLGDSESAAIAYRAAIIAYPDAENRAQLDQMATQAGIVSDD